MIPGIRVSARGRTATRVTGRMNQTERRYEAEILRPRFIAGEVLWWRFEGLKLRLADATFYDTDFIVMLADGSLEVHEVKGFMEDDAAVKIKVAAEQYPFPFFLCRYIKKQWEVNTV